MNLSKPMTRVVPRGTTAAKLQVTLDRLDRILETVASGSAGLARTETKQVIRLLRAACHRGLERLNGISYPGMAKELKELMRQHARVWRLRNREGGLADSLARFEAVRREHERKE